MRQGKTTKLLADLKEQLDNGKIILVAGLKSPEDYLNRLGEGYEAKENFIKESRIKNDNEISYWDGYDMVKIGYIFRKV